MDGRNRFKGNVEVRGSGMGRIVIPKGKQNKVLLLHICWYLIVTFNSTTFNNISFKLNKDPLKKFKETKFHLINPSQKNKTIATTHWSPQND